MDILLQDVRYAARTLVKNPGFAALTILCLALGIGVNSTIFSLVDTLVIRPLPFRAPEELVRLTATQPSNGIDRGRVSPPDLRDWRDRTHVFADMAAIGGRNFTLSDRGEPERLVGSIVTWNLFPMLGVDPVLGRQFRADEDRPGGPPVVILSDGLWRRRYAADRSIVGRAVTMNGNAYVVVGVMPPRFQFPFNTQLWIPQEPIESTATRAARDLVVYARLKPNTSLDAARRDVEAAADRLAHEYPEDKGWRASALTLRDDFSVGSDARLSVLTMMGSVTLVLLIACANVANLLLARATIRQREMAVRAALGAGRGRIVRQLLTESVLIAAASAPVGVVLAYIGLLWFTSAIPPAAQLPYYIDWSMNPRIVLYTVVVSLLTGFVFGLAPALQTLRTNVNQALKSGGRGVGGLGRQRVRHALVVIEIAMSLVLLVGASLFVRSFLNLQSAKSILDTSPLMTMRFFMDGDAYKQPDAMVRRAEDIVRRVEALPGVVSAMASNMVPLGGGGSASGAVPDGVAFEAGKEPSVDYFAITPHVFRTLNVPILVGRDFTDADGQGRSGVAIVNQAFAHRLWPSRSDILGQTFRLTADKRGQPITIVGIVGDFQLFTVRDRQPRPYAFVSYAYDAAPNTGLTIRVAGRSPASITSAARQEIRTSDPTLPLLNVRTGDEARELSYWQDRLLGWMFAIFGAVALVLASIGVYGVLSYAVSQRRQEIGIRVALGASRQNVFGLVVSHAAKLAGFGILLGVLGAFAATRIVATLLYNVSATDPLSFVATAMFLALVAFAASYVPARRAVAVDPLIALRDE
jgi:putative ABC transport system permease protein